MSDNISFESTCPVPISEHEHILLAHGSGGTYSARLIKDIFLRHFGNPYLNELHDGAVFEVEAGQMALSTDSYVVDPIFFPGGNIGDLAINGTVNDIACCGAKPLFISAGFIIEEGFAIADLDSIAASMAEAAKRAGVSVVTGDTKVVGRGKADRIFINTSGVGLVREGISISPRNCMAGDLILLNGSIASHGIAIMASREGFEFESAIMSDSAPLNGLAGDICKAGGSAVRVMRDPTRGGLASALNEIASSAGMGIEIVEDSIPIDEQVRGICEILGFDPLYVANEGKLLVFVAPEKADEVLSAMRNYKFGADAAIIGRVSADNPGKVIMKTSIGTRRIVDMLSGDQLPRIC